MGSGDTCYVSILMGDGSLDWFNLGSFRIYDEECALLSFINDILLI